MARNMKPKVQHIINLTLILILLCLLIRCALQHEISAMSCGVGCKKRPVVCFDSRFDELQEAGPELTTSCD